ncbi:MAG: 16S rRNA (uracil(1498)-N(3))-methyltransferase [Bacteroidales bacterium]|nr:16S rRNA (uracil(1498)-N(3))-methyltransferase [Bacteroidales bacterium]
MNLFYDPTITFSPAIPLPFLHFLNEEESRHCVKVLRMRVGNEVYLTNGQGFLFTGKLCTLNPGSCEIEITALTKHEPADYSIHIAVAPIKNMSRFEWFLEKATEIGINEVTPLICARSEKISVRTDRMNKIITAALKQSLGVFHPILNEPVGYKKFLEKTRESGKYIGWCETKDEPLFTSICLPRKDVVVLIGPEGDFTAEEVVLAKETGYLPISLGNNRLRTETAALAACFAVHFVNGKI